MATLSPPSPNDGLLGSWPGLPVSGQGFYDLLHEEMYLEDGTSPSVTFNLEGMPLTAKRTFLINWADVLTAGPRVVGYAIRQNDINANTRLSRWLPECHPKIPYLCARRAGPTLGVTWTDKEAVVTSEGIRYVNKFLKCELPVEYEAVDYRIFGDQWIGAVDQWGTAGMHNSEQQAAGYSDTQPALGVGGGWYFTEFDRFVSYGAKPSTKSFAPNPGGFYWGSTSPQPGKQFTGSVSMFLSFVDLTWTWHGVPLRCLPIQRIQGCVGAVNKNWVRPIPGLFNNDGTPFACKPHQLYFNSWDMKKRVDSLGQWVGDITYLIRYNPIKWTRFYDHLTTTKNADGAIDTGPPAAPAGRHNKWWYITQDPAAAPYAPGNVNDGVAPFPERDYRELFAAI